MISRVEVLQNIYLRVYNPPIVIGFTSLVSLVTMLFFSPLHALLIAVSMMLTLWFVPWISAKRVRLIKQYVSHEQREFLTRFYDYNESYEELNRFKQTEQFKNDVINRLKKYDYMQLKEQKFLSLYDYVLNIIAMVSIFMSLLLGAQQVYTGQLNEVYLTSIVLMVLTLFEQAVPMSNVAFYKADTDQALDEINEVIAPVTTEMSGISNNNHSELSLFEMKDVTFSYWNQQTPTLHGINITIEEGEKVAIIGPSGSGKNTLLQVLLGLFQVRKGVVTLNGEQVYDIDNTKEYHRINVML